MSQKRALVLSIILTVVFSVGAVAFNARVSESGSSNSVSTAPAQTVESSDAIPTTSATIGNDGKYQVENASKSDRNDDVEFEDDDEPVLKRNAVHEEEDDDD